MASRISPVRVMKLADLICIMRQSVVSFVVTHGLHYLHDTQRSEPDQVWYKNTKRLPLE